MTDATPAAAPQVVPSNSASPSSDGQTTEDDDVDFPNLNDDNMVNPDGGEAAVYDSVSVNNPKPAVLDSPQLEMLTLIMLWMVSWISQAIPSMASNSPTFPSSSSFISSNSMQQLQVAQRKV